MNLNDPVSEINGVGDKKSAIFNRLKIYTIDDLIHFFPKKYLDYSNVDLIKNIHNGPVCLKVKFRTPKTKYISRSRTLTEAIASDSTGSILVIWFNQSYRASSIELNHEYYLVGNYELSYNHFSIINPSIEKVNPNPINTARILPIYKETKNLNSKDIRKALSNCIELSNSYEDIYPKSIFKDLGLMKHSVALKEIHFPSSSDSVELAKNRLAFNSIFDLILSAELNAREIDQTRSLKIDLNITLAKDFVETLPFKLTDDQRQVIWQIMKDLNKHRPMNRLVEGDVGSGKTVIAAMIALLLINKGYQTALMAPTEILAKQHYININKLYKHYTKNVYLLSSSTSNKDRKDLMEALKSKQPLLVIGTHALLNSKLEFTNLAFVCVDEQHRFGVNQRKLLKQKANYLPHLLSLSATPIPRSLALTLFKELKISVIKTKPKQDTIIHTYINSKSEYLRNVENIKKLLVKGQQMFVVVPKINSKIDQDDSLENVLNETTKLFKDFKIDYLHGKLKSDVKNQKIEDYLNKKIDILVSTTVIEVGIDIPNATIIVIYSSDSFGLAQLHQLRGRIGRGHLDGFCYLLYDDNKIPSRRLEALKSTNNGFELAELDLKIRGPGAIYGNLQHGILDLRLVDFYNNSLISLAHKAVEMFMNNPNNLLQYKSLLEKVNNLRKIVNLD